MIASVSQHDAPSPARYDVLEYDLQVRRAQGPSFLPTLGHAAPNRLLPLQGLQSEKRTEDLVIQISTVRRRRELVTTEIDDALMAMAANMGLIRMPITG